MKIIFLLISVFLICINILVVPAYADCLSMIEDYSQWLRSSGNVEFDYMFLKTRSDAEEIIPRVNIGDGIPEYGYGAWGQGRFRLSNNGLESEIFEVYFSDRPNREYGDFGSDFYRQPFSNSRSDQQSINISRDSEVDITLHSWGDTKLRLNELECSNDNRFISGLKEEVNGISHVSIVLSKR